MDIIAELTGMLNIPILILGLLIGYLIMMKKLKTNGFLLST